MPKLLVLADDLTGAVDTGVQMSALGVSVFVDLGRGEDARVPEGVQALVVNTSSRHLKPVEAYRRVRDTAARALQRGVEIIYKKTDSGLRGNVGAELQAVMDAAGDDLLAFVPAYPKLGRTVSGGRLYIDGVPVSESVFGHDLFTPVRHDTISDILAEQCAAPVVSAVDGVKPDRGVWLFDARDEWDMAHAARVLQATDGIRLYAGCAGFAACLSALIPMERRAREALPASRRFLVVSGSVSETTLAQLARARERGYESVTLRGEDLYVENLLQTPRGQALLASLRASLKRSRRAIVDAVGSTERIAQNMAIASAMGLRKEDARVRVARNVGALASAALRAEEDVTLGVFGGDTLYETLSALGCRGIEPLCEIAPGVVYSVFQLGDGRRVTLVSKSGNFGGADLIERIDSFLSAHEREGAW